MTNFDGIESDIELRDAFEKVNPKQKQFRLDMEKAGYPVQEYHGRFFYHGWAVCTGEETGEMIDLQDVMSATKVKLQWDNLGYDSIVYLR